MGYKIDFAFSEDGDIVLGLPRLDADGDILYLHKDGTIDKFQGEDGRELLDFAYRRNRDAYKQIILNRLKTDAPDWYHHPQMGGNLSDLIGEANTRETAARGARYIVDALTYENFLNPHQVLVRPVPISHEEILFVITIHLDDNDPFQLPLVFNLTHGLKEV